MRLPTPLGLPRHHRAAGRVIAAVLAVAAIIAAHLHEPNLWWGAHRYLMPLSFSYLGLAG